MGKHACRECGKEFEIHGQGPYKYCEAHRLSRAEAQNRAQRNKRTRRRDARSPATCRVCGKQFIAMRSDANKCSDECKRLDLNRRARESEERHRGCCVDCGTPIARRSQRCHPCSQKPRIESITGPNNYAWKGGKTWSRGYVYLLVAPEARKGHRYRAEHIVVWEQTHGRPLPEGWVVHHKNGIKHDNRPENLEALPRGRHNHYQRRAAMLERELSEVKAEMAKIQRVNQT